MGDYIQTLKELLTAGGEGQAPKVSVQTMYRSLGIEYEEEQRKIRKEAIDNAIHMKELQSLSAMSLDELRGLKEEDVIPEPKNSPLPGEEGEQPEGAMAGGLPGMEGAPPLGGLEMPPGPAMPPMGPPPAAPAPPPAVK